MRPADRARWSLIASMVIFGSIGVFRRAIPLPSGMIAAVRGLTGMAFLLAAGRLRGTKPAWGSIRRQLPLLLISGAALGFNWMLLFEAYRHTSVAVATLCYYTAPVMVVLLSPVILREKLTLRKLLCVLAALLGAALVGGTGQADTAGVLLGLGAAALYAAVILMNKFLGGVPAADRTLVQLGAAGVLLLPYALLAEAPDPAGMTFTALILLLVVGAVHTGVAYWLYFGSMEELSGQTVALYSYIDPVAAILFSVLLLGEPLTLPVALGAALVLGATLISERKGG